MNIDIEFCRHLLRGAHKLVKEHFPSVRLRDAWVWHAGRNHWEFHYAQGGPFYWHGSAGNAYEARYKGWMAWLDKNGIK